MPSKSFVPSRWKSPLVPVALVPSISFCSNRMLVASAPKKTPLSVKSTKRLLKNLRRVSGPATVSTPRVPP